MKRSAGGQRSDHRSEIGDTVDVFEALGRPQISSVLRVRNMLEIVLGTLCGVSSSFGAMSRIHGTRYCSWPEHSPNLATRVLRTRDPEISGSSLILGFEI